MEVSCGRSKTKIKEKSYTPDPLKRVRRIVYASRIPPRPIGGLEAWRLGSWERKSMGGFEL